MTLQPVSFSKPVIHEPRLSPAYVPGRQSSRFYTDAEKAVIERYYPVGGATACMAHLPPHRTLSSVYAMAHKMGLCGPKGGPGKPITPPADLDDQLRAAWHAMDGKKRGEVSALAAQLELPRWYVSKRLRKLGLALPHKKEPAWTAAEEALLDRLPLHDPDRCAEILREHGFSRSPTAIVIRCKRLKISRRDTHAAFTATEASKILGVDSKGVTREILAGRLVATKRSDRRLAQQGGSSWDIAPADLRRYIIDNLGHIDFRKVDKFDLVDVLIGASKPERLA